MDSINLSRLEPNDQQLLLKHLDVLKGALAYFEELEGISEDTKMIFIEMGGKEEDVDGTIFALLGGEDVAAEDLNDLLSYMKMIRVMSFVKDGLETIGRGFGASSQVSKPAEDELTAQGINASATIATRLLTTLCTDEAVDTEIDNPVVGHA